jgi:hypothetical protein
MRHVLASTSRFLAAAFALAVVTMTATTGARALEPLRGEEAAIKACDKRLCALLTQKNPKGEDLECALTKTWQKSQIKEAESSKLTWGYGDARCTVDINLSRETLLEAMAADKRKYRVPSHTVNCIVEQDGKLEKVTAKLAPRITFKDGRADKIWVNLREVEGPAGIRAVLVMAAELADRLGLFHKRMVKSVNRYIERHCPREFPEVASKSKPARSK